jgi:hypothetical protein
MKDMAAVPDGETVVGTGTHTRCIFSTASMHAGSEMGPFSVFIMSGVTNVVSNCPIFSCTVDIDE